MESSTSSSWTEISDHNVQELSAHVARMSANVKTLTELIFEMNMRLKAIEARTVSSTVAVAVPAPAPSIQQSVQSTERLTMPLFSIGPRAQHVRESNRALRTKELIPFDKELGQM